MRDLYDYVRQFYRENEFPALHAQIAEWRQTCPLEGLSVLDATPIFRNTMCKYCALLAAGARLSVRNNPQLPADEKVWEMLPQFGIRRVTAKENDESYDLITDCAGSCAKLKSRLGFVELTRSGLEYYRDCAQPVFSADSGLLKKLETALGTGDGFIRGMKYFGYPELKGKKILIFGGGKVGRGIAWHALKAGTVVSVADLNACTSPAGARFLRINDTAAILNAIKEAWCIVSVTGLPSALASWSRAFLESEALLVNMGAEDEYGPDFPAERVLNGKKALNFALEEPTHLKYIDASMALDNYGAELLAQHRLPPGISNPGAELENKILSVIRENGILDGEIDIIHRL